MKLILFTFHFFVICFGYSQNLIVSLNNSTVETFPIVNIQSIKFGTNSMILNELDGTVNTWNISDINNYSFDGLSGVEDNIELKKSNFTVFPNPSVGSVNFQYLSNLETLITIEIIDASGKLIEQIYHGGHSGNKLYKWEANVQDGIYYCRISTENKTISKPLIIK